MKQWIFAALLFFAASTSIAAQQLCVCTTGCKIASDPYPPGAAQPTSCTIYKGGVAIASSPTVLSTTIPTNNASVCMPASSTYLPGVAGSVACQVVIPAQVAGSVTVTMTATNGAGETAASTPLVFTSVAALPVLPPVPANLRPN
jgi:hypothetical protein